MSCCAYLTPPAFWSSMKYSLLVAASCQIVPAFLHNLTLGASGSPRKNFSVASEAWLCLFLLLAVISWYLPLLQAFCLLGQAFPAQGAQLSFFTGSRASTAWQRGNHLATVREQGRHNTVHTLTDSTALPYTWRGPAVLTGCRFAAIKLKPFRLGTETGHISVKGTLDLKSSGNHLRFIAFGLVVLARNSFIIWKIIYIFEFIYLLSRNILLAKVYIYFLKVLSTLVNVKKMYFLSI